MTPEQAPNRWLRPPEGGGAEALAELVESIRQERATFLVALLPDDRIRFGITEKENLYTREIRAETTRRLIGQFRFAALDVRSGLPPREYLAAIPAPGAPRALVFWSGFEALEQAARLELIHSLNLSREALRASGAQMVFLLTREAYAAFSEQALDLMAWAPPPIRFEPDVFPSTPLGEQPYPLLVQQLATIHELSAHVFSGRMDGGKAVLASDLAKRLMALNLREPASEVLRRVARFHSERRHTGKLERLYLDYVIDRYQRLDVFSIIEDAPITVELARAYVKLKVERGDDGESATHRAQSGEEPERKNERQLARLEGRGEPREMEAEAAITTHPRLVILGAPGSGKTTLLKYLALTAARTEANPASCKLPFLVSAAALARELRESRERLPHLPELMSRVFQRLAPWLGLNADFFSQVLSQGRGLLLIDGLDEVANAQDRQQVVALVQAAAGQWRECQWVLSSRPHGFQSVASQGLPGFALAHVQPLDDAGMVDFVQGWYLAVETAARGDSPATRETARSTADKLIAAIQAARGVRELASNPLLLGVLALVHRRNVTLPQRRTELYDECTQQLLGYWDQVQGREVADAGLNRDEKRFLLQPLARWFHERGSAGASADREAVEGELRRLFIGLFGDDEVLAARRARAFLSDIQERAGLLVEREEGLFAFSHLTFQEYLAARAISEEEEADQQAFMLARLHDPWWREVTLLLAGHLADVRHLGQRGRRMAVRLIRAVREAGSLHEDILRRDLLLAGRMACDLGKLGVDEKDREWLRALLLEVHQVWKATAFTKVAEEAGDIQALAPEWAVSEELRGAWRALARGEYQTPQQNRALGLIYSLLQLRDADDLREILVLRAAGKSSSSSAKSLWRLLADSGLRDPRLPPLCRVALLNRNHWLATLAARTLWHNHGQHEVLAWLDGLPAEEKQPWWLPPLLTALNSRDGEILEPLLVKWLGENDWRRDIALHVQRTMSSAPLSPQIEASLVSLIEKNSSDLRWWELWMVLAFRASDRLLEQMVSTLLARPASHADYWKNFFVLPRITARLRPETAQAVIEEVISTGEVFYAIPALQHFADKGREWALARLRELAGHEKTHTAIRALLALSELHSGDTLPRLQALAHTGPAWQRADATQALGQTEIGAALPDWCLQAFSDRAVSVRAACADYLARRVNEVEDTQALAHLLALARHPSPTCKQAAWRALGELPSTPLLDGWWREWFSDNRTTPEGMSAAVALTLRWAEQPEAMQQQLESFWEENCRKPDAITTWHTTTTLRHAAGNPRTPADLAYDMLRRIAEARAASGNS